MIALPKVAIAFLLVSGVLLIPGESSAQQRRETRSADPRAELKQAERRLSELGYKAGPADGVIDKATRKLWSCFRNGKDESHGSTHSPRLRCDHERRAAATKGSRLRPRRNRYRSTNARVVRQRRSSGEDSSRLNWKQSDLQRERDSRPGVHAARPVQNLPRRSPAGENHHSVCFTTRTTSAMDLRFTAILPCRGRRKVTAAFAFRCPRRKR